MKLSELSGQYAQSVRLLSRRIGQLRAVRRRTRDQEGRRALTERIRVLEVMRRETREMEALTAGYYRKNDTCPGRRFPL